MKKEHVILQLYLKRLIINDCCVSDVGHGCSEKRDKRRKKAIHAAETVRSKWVDLKAIGALQTPLLLLITLSLGDSIFLFTLYF